MLSAMRCDRVQPDNSSQSNKSAAILDVPSSERLGMALASCKWNIAVSNEHPQSQTIQAFEPNLANPKARHRGDITQVHRVKRILKIANSGLSLAAMSMLDNGRCTPHLDIVIESQRLEPAMFRFRLCAWASLAEAPMRWKSFTYVKSYD
eukprot:3091932-Amphidinium_carterae.1